VRAAETFRRFSLTALLLSGCVTAWAQAPVGELFASGGANVKGEVRLAGGGTILLSGSSVSAGSAPAVLKLARGGEVRICPATALTATAGKRTELTFGIGTGALELRYDLDAHSDLVVTPDFRLLLAGPASFRLAVGTRSNGDTCLKSLEGNAGAVIVTEQLGDGTFQLRPGDAVLFRGGNINQVMREPGLPCGCPAPAPVMMAESPAPKPAAPATPATASAPVETQPVAVAAASPAPAESPAPAPLAESPAPAPRKNLVIDVPMAFSGDSPIPPAPQPVSRASLAKLSAQDVNLWFAPAVQPPPKPAKRGFFARFFGALFGRHKSS
jgi:hypothetical protein